MSDSITTDAETQSVRWYSHYPITEASAGYGLQQLYLDFLFFYAQKHMMKFDSSAAACVIVPKVN